MKPDGKVISRSGISPETKPTRNSRKCKIHLRDTAFDRFSGSGISRNLSMGCGTCVLGENDIRDKDRRRSGCGIAGIRIPLPLSDPVT